MAEEDWYSLVPKDINSSSDDEQSKEPDETKGMAESCGLVVPTPVRGEGRRSLSPSTHVTEAQATAKFRLEADLDSKDELNSTTSNLFFDDHIDEPENSGGTAQERWQRTDAYMRDVQQAFRTRPDVRVQSHDRYMKLLLVGEPGLGKDMFIKNIFAPYCADNDLPVNGCEPETEPMTFQNCPSDYCTEICVDVDEGRTKVHYLIQDTPGTHLTGADVAILKHVLRQNQEYMSKEEDPKRVVPLGSLPDPRVDACIFFLSPHFLKPQDVTLMKKLSEFVPVIPVIAKADALTTSELEEYRQHIKQKLDQVSMQVGRPVMHAFSPADLKAAGAVRQVPPFAVISSSEVDHEVGSHWFTRTFPWGQCEVMSSNHSDVPALKALLFECCFESLKAATEARFYSARESFLTTRALSKALSSGELPPEATKLAGLQTSLSPRSVREPLLDKSGEGPFARHTTVKCDIPKGKAKVQESKGWSWPLGITIGVVTVAICVQLAALGIYARNTAHFKALASAYQQEASAEKQVVAELLRSLSHNFE